jgi:hypothetical protein
LTQQEFFKPSFDRFLSDFDFTGDNMANVFIIPVIRREDYDAFLRDVGPNLADTYDEWAKLFAKEVAEARRLGNTVIETVVNYDEFVRYCATYRQKPDPQILLNFVRSKPIAEA